MGTPIVAFANQKGGVGKTSAVLQTAMYLSDRAELGKPILVVDMDPQGNTSTRLAQRVDMEGLKKTRAFDLFSDELIEINPLRVRDNCDLIYSLRNDIELTEVEARKQETLLLPKQQLQDIIDSEHYGAILIDCPPAISHKLYAALNMATHCVAPIEVSGFATDGINGLVDSIQRVQAINEDLEFAGVFVNKFSSRSDRHKREVQRLRDALGDLVFNDMLCFRVAIDEANTDGIPVWTLAKGSARVAYKEVEKIIHEIMSRTGIKSVNPKFRMRNSG